MSKRTGFTQKIQPIISFVRRPAQDSLQPTKHFHNEVHTPMTTNKHHVQGRILPNSLEEISFDTNPQIQSNVEASSEKYSGKKLSKEASISIGKDSPINSNEMINSRETEKAQKGKTECLKKLTPKQLSILKIVAVILIVCVVTMAAIFTPIYLLIIRQSSSQSSITNITVSVCSTTTCIGKETPFHASIIVGLYPFDGNAVDLISYTVGTLLGSTTPGFTGSCYVGTQAISLSALNLQYVLIRNVNLARQSFTIELWLNIANVPLSSELGIFSQCDLSLKCLVISIRNYHFSVTFDSMGTNNTLTGTSLLSTNYWIHLAVVYDATLYQQQIYINGNLDAYSTGIVAAYQGSSTGVITTVGKTTSAQYGTTYFYGTIDHLVISSAARTACEIYNDATLTAYYPFDSSNTFNDYSVNLFDGTAFSTTIISQGAIGQALNFSSSMSYFQSRSFPYLQINNPPFSISIWVNPASIGFGGSIIHFSTLQNGNGGCFDLLVLDSSGEAVVQWMPYTTSINNTRGPVLPINTWTHLAIVFGSFNGMRLYVNGQISTASTNTGNTAMSSYGSPQYITMGNISPLGSSAALNCRNGTVPILPGAFTGGIDEYRLYNRELTIQEICVLANL